MSGDKLNIGSITSGYRKIKEGKSYDRLFPKPESEDRIIIQDGEVEDTVGLMKKVVWRYIGDTQKIAPQLKASDTRSTCRNIWEFLYHHIQYKLDQRGLEQLRRPARSWADRKSGIDCDCFSIFASSILCQLQIPHAFRITKYGGPYFQHVYVVVPHGNGLVLIDPVLSQFDYEKPFSEHKDFSMNLSGIDVAVLSGHPQDEHQNLLLNGPKWLDIDESKTEAQMEAVYNYLVSTRNTVASNPEFIAHIEDPTAFLKMLDYAINYWYTDQRDQALEVLAENEQRINLQNGFSGLDSPEDEDLHWAEDYLDGSRKGFFQRVGDFAKRVGKGVSKAAKNVGKAIVRYNPVSVTARLGFLAAMKMDLRKMASKLKWAYASQAQAAQKGISSTQWQRSRSALAKIERLYADKLQGKRSALKDAILKGRAGGLNGQLHPEAYQMEGLGEPITVGASIAAATPVIVAAIKILKDAGLFAPGEDSSTENLEKDVAAAQGKSSLPAALTIPNQQAPRLNPLLTPGGSTTHAFLPPSIAPGANTPEREGKGFMAFVKKNPVLSVAGASVLAFGAYQMLKPRRPARRTALAGPRRKRSTTSKKTGAQRAIPKLNLK